MEYSWTINYLERQRRRCAGAVQVVGVQEERSSGGGEAPSHVLSVMVVDSAGLAETRNATRPEPGYFTADDAVEVYFRRRTLFCFSNLLGGLGRWFDWHICKLHCLAGPELPVNAWHIQG